MLCALDNYSSILMAVLGRSWLERVDILFRFLFVFWSRYWENCGSWKTFARRIVGATKQKKTREIICLVHWVVGIFLAWSGKRTFVSFSSFTPKWQNAWFWPVLTGRSKYSFFFLTHNYLIFSCIFFYSRRFRFLLSWRSQIWFYHLKKSVFSLDNDHRRYWTKCSGWTIRKWPWSSIPSGWAMRRKSIGVYRLVHRVTSGQRTTGCEYCFSSVCPFSGNGDDRD